MKILQINTGHMEAKNLPLSELNHCCQVKSNVIGLSVCLMIVDVFTGLSTLPIQQLLEQLRWHQKQLLAGMALLCVRIYV